MGYVEIIVLFATTQKVVNYKLPYPYHDLVE